MSTPYDTKGGFGGGDTLLPLSLRGCVGQAG